MGPLTHTAIPRKRSVHRAVRYAVPLVVLWLCATPVHSQYSSSAAHIKARYLNMCDSMVLLLVKDAPLADGWLLTHAQLTDSSLTGIVQRAHPLAVSQLECSLREKKHTGPLYDLPECFLLVHVPDTLTAGLVPGQAYTLPLSAVQDTRRIAQNDDGRNH